MVNDTMQKIWIGYYLGVISTALMTILIFGIPI